jgi:ATP-binding protein involved in chromosome partitioning
MAADADVPFLGELPIDPRVAECGDQGEPIVQRYPDSPVAQAYLKLASSVAEAARLRRESEGLPLVDL